MPGEVAGERENSLESKVPAAGPSGLRGSQEKGSKWPGTPDKGLPPTRYSKAFQVTFPVWFQAKALS